MDPIRHLCGGATILALFSLGALPAQAGVTAPTSLSALSIEELGEIQVTSVSKRAESVNQAPSAVYVITHDDIIRSGAASVPEILRLAPNLQVTQTSSSNYVITARGSNGAPAAQNFSNKLLVLIDGRSVYTPLFSGVYWDMQDVLPQDIDRIEVISGPGATLWGANAVNGVINITTRKSSETQGGFAQVRLGNQRREANLRLGGRAGEALTWRVYARTFEADDTYRPAGPRNNDHWSKPQVGFRLDWSPTTNDLVTVQGDAYHGFEAQPGAQAQNISGNNLTARWSRTLNERSALQAQVYYDHVRRGGEVDGSGFYVDTFDLDVQHSLTLGARHQIVWGGGFRSSRYRIRGTASLQFSPARRNLTLSNLFLHDTIALTSTTRLVLGVKLEDDPYVSPEVLPNARLSWSPSSALTLWAAASRAVRSPTPFDRDVVEILNGQTFLTGGSDFQPERLTAYEAGMRVRVSHRASFALSTYYNLYDDLRSIEIAPGGFLPLRWGNQMRGRASGVEFWSDYQALPWWRLSASLTVMDERFRFKAGASRILGLAQAGNSPKYQASLKSAMNLGEKVTLDAMLRYVSALPDPRVPAYVELNGRIGWNLTERVQISVVGQNLLHKRHVEYVQGAAIPRSVMVDLQWRF